MSDLKYLRQLHSEIEEVLKMYDLKTPVDFDDCGGEQGTVTSIDVEPNPPTIGKTVSLKVSGTTKSAFSITKVTATAYVSGIPISSHTVSVSQSCPVGTCVVSLSMDVPAVVPAGTYQIEAKAGNDKSANLVCGKATVTLKKAVEDSVPVHDCGGSSASVAKVDVTPFPPKVGGSVTLAVSGTASKSFSFTKIKATIYVGGVPLSTQTISATGSCSAGACSIKQSLDVPSIVPAGTYDVQVQAQNSADTNLVCGKATIQLVKEEELEQPVSVKDCGGAFGTVSSVDVTPYPPVIGKAVTLKVTGTAKQTFTTEKIAATVYTAGVPISTQTIAVTDTCSAGDCSLTLSLNVPSVVPAGTYDVEVKSQSSKSSNQMCGRATVQLVKALEQSIDFSDCAGSSGTVTSVDVSPYPPKIGTDVTIDVVGNTKSAFDVTKLKVVVYVAGIPITTQTVAVTTSCPAGTCTIHESFNVPSVVPAGTYTLEVFAQNANDSNLVCAKAKLTLQ